MPDLLQIQNLSAGYGQRPVLQDINLSLKEGEVLAIIGQNGCGKSTLLKTIARIIQDNSGDIYFDGNKLNSMQPWQLRQIGISWFVQGGMVFPSLKVSEHFDLSLRSTPKHKAKEIVDECLTWFPALKEVMSKRGGNLSGGLRQMLSFSMLISQQTKCWLLDEPTAGLAPAVVDEVCNFLLKMKELKRTAMLLVEHNYSVALKVADKVCHIEDGRMNHSMAPIELMSNN